MTATALKKTSHLGGGLKPNMTGVHGPGSECVGLILDKKVNPAVLESLHVFLDLFRIGGLDMVEEDGNILLQFF